MWNLAELSYEEAESARLLMDVLEENGFAVTSKGTARVPTAFVAEWGSGTPVLGFLPEYDALPGLGNEAVPRREPREDGKTSGHGCGHNLLGAGLVGAAVTLEEVVVERGIPGTLRVYGCAAEEAEGARVYIGPRGVVLRPRRGAALASDVLRRDAEPAVGCSGPGSGRVLRQNRARRHGALERA